MSKHIVIIPTYNECENIRSIIEAVLALEKSFDILVVDDGSPDGTADIVKEMMAKHPKRIFILERSGKLGLGTAYIAGFRYALEQGYGFIYEMDADFSHPPQKLVNMAAVLESGIYDLVVGSRYINGGAVENWPQNRLFLSRGASLYVQTITRMPVKDPTAGFVGYTSELLNRIDLDKIQFIGYAFQIEMKFAAWTLGFRIKEIPITFKDRTLGQSKMSTNIISEAVFGVLKMKMKSFRATYRK